MHKHNNAINDFYYYTWRYDKFMTQALIRINSLMIIQHDLFERTCVNEDARDSQLWLISAASINIGFLAIKRSLWFNAARFCASPLYCWNPIKAFYCLAITCANVTAVTINSDDAGLRIQSHLCRTARRQGGLIFHPFDVTTDPACAWWLNTVPISIPMHITYQITDKVCYFMVSYFTYFVVH